MLLRTRITLMVAMALLLVTAGLLGSGAIREQLSRQQQALAANAAQSAQWAESLAVEDRVLDTAMDKLALLPQFQQASQRGDQDAMRQAIAGQGLLDGSDPPFALAAVMELGSAPAIWGLRPDYPLLETDSLERASVGASVDGLRQVSNTQVVVLSAKRLTSQKDPALLVLARDVSHPMAQLARRIDASVTLLDLHGRLLRTTDPLLWQQVAPHIAPRGAQHFVLTVDDHTYTVTGTVANDLAGHALGTLITLTDTTANARASRFLEQLALGATIALVVAVLLGLNWYLRHSLRPLEDSIDALQALAKGDTEVRLLGVGNDEIGRIAQAVATFRRNARDLIAARALRERMRRRQERLLRTKLQVLADATHQFIQFKPGLSDEDQLRQLGQVMNELSARLIDQHQRLTGVVQELREALIAKNRLAGLEQELQIAAQVQLSILPRHALQDERIALHCEITPAREVGGDFYDYFLIDPDHLGFVIADVSGKGIPAALFMTITRTLLKATAQFVTEPTRCVAQVNDLLAAENEQMMFVTLFYGLLELRTGRVRYVNAGHNPPWVLRGNGEPALLQRTGGMAVAVSEGFPYQEGTTTLAPGDLLFLYTDGVTEAFNPDGQEYGEPRLRQTLSAAFASAKDNPTEIVNHVLTDIQSFVRDAPQSDDITCVALGYRGNA